MTAADETRIRELAREAAAAAIARGQGPDPETLARVADILRPALAADTRRTA